LRYLVLLPLFPALWFIAKRGLADALVDVYLPILVLVPMYSPLLIPHLVSVTAADAALLPIAIAALIKYRGPMRLRRADVWMALFLLCSGFELGNLEITQSLRTIFEHIFVIGLPYIVGRFLLEQEGVRVRFIRRFLWLLAFVAVVSLVEFRLGRNLFAMFWMPVFGTPPNIEQVRGGFERVQGPFGHAIGAGMIYAVAWILALWLRDFDKLDLGSTERKFFGLRSSTVLVGLMFMGLLIAYSRGPWTGAAVAFAIALIGRAKNVARTTVIVVVLGIVVGGVAYRYLDAYSSAAVAKDQDQENAIYRRQLLDAYQPIVSYGGLFGWGEGFPRVPGLYSIDNYYLYIEVTQGTVGLWTFLLVSAEAIISLFLFARTSLRKTEFGFAISMLALLAGSLLTLGSNGLMYQIQEIYFLCIGWALSLSHLGAAAVREHKHLNPALTTRRILT
jgi:O-Antigen ligase